MTGCRMDDHAGRLVHDRDICIFVDDVDGYCFGDEMGYDDGGNDDRHVLTKPDFRRRIGLLAVHADFARTNQRLDTHPGKTGSVGNHEAVEAMPLIRFVDDEVPGRWSVRVWGKVQFCLVKR